MKKIIALLLLSALFGNNKLRAQLVLVDDMEGNGPASGNWIYNAGANATGSVLFHEPNPAPSGLNKSSHVAKFTKDTTCSPYMAAAVTLGSPFDLSGNNTFKMLVYSNVIEEVLFKLQPGGDFAQAVFQTYRIKNINQWEEAVFTFPGASNRTDLNRITIQFMDGKKANGILYFDQIQAPNSTSINLTKMNIPMGQENGKVIEVKLSGDKFKTTLNVANWISSGLPQGVSIGNLLRMNDTTVNIVLSGNSTVNYSTTTFTLTVNGNELQNPNIVSYNAKGIVVFDGNPGWTMIYYDEFETEGLPDRTKWNIDPHPKGWINSEQQVYTDSTRDNARVRNGNLVITGKKDFPTGNPDEPWSSARVTSLRKMEFLYGKVEMRAKLPRARGSWPAFWLMPTTNAYGNWPKSGEVDILEHVGNSFGKAMAAVHTENKNWTNGGNLGGNQMMPDLDTVYHVYGLEWSPDSLRFTHDGVGFYTYVNPQTDWKDWPFDKPFYVILNIAMGGGMGGNIVEADWPDSMLVDWVHISQKGLGTPVLNSIIITPDSISVLPGKTQQFIARIQDQNGHVINGITPTWSISGTGNVINADGFATIQSSGVVTATTTVENITVSGLTNITVRPTDYKSIPARIEAEDFDNSNVCCTETTADTSGVLNVSYIGKGSWFEYDIDVPDSKAYRLQLRVAANSASSLKIAIDTTELTTVQLPASGGWQTWITVISAPIVFGPGQKTIRLTSESPGWNFNWLQIVKANKHKVKSVVIQPDSARIFAGESLQFKALGYDKDSNYIMLSPDPVWTVSSSNAAVNTTGLFTSDSAGQYTIIAASSKHLSGSAIVNVFGVPVLTRIEIKPDTLIIPVGASQQYTAKGFDQYDTQVPLTDTVFWFVTGNDNTIGTNGLLTAGNMPGTYFVTATSGGVSRTLELELGYTCTVNNRYEAESASSNAAGPYLVNTDDTDGGRHFEGITAGKWFAYSALKVPSAGKYNIRLRVSTTAPAKIKIGHGAFTFRIIDVPSTGGQWQTISDTLTLPALSYTGINAVSGTFKFNWFTIDNCAELPKQPVRMELTPDMITLAVGGTHQFAARGYDINNQPVSLSAPLQWSVNGTNNTVDSSGLVTVNSATGIYAVIATAGTLTDTAWVNVVECSVNTKYEAESFSARHSGPVLETCSDLGGGQNFTGLAPGHYFAYNTLNVPATGLYRISFRVSSTAPAQIKIGHSNYNFGVITIPSTGGQWQTITDTITLPALSYTGIHVVSGTFRFNWFVIDNCGTVPKGISFNQSAAGYSSEMFYKNGKSSLSVYPNPTTGHVVIKPDDTIYHTMKLFDSHGRLIHQWKTIPGQLTISKDFSFLKNGIYILKLEGINKQQTLRIVKL
ncbi:carbohydrate-binding protein [Flavitalea sp.]|nr:carbohydrate-binding protein [Flavitalea sp.]